MKGLVLQTRQKLMGVERVEANLLRALYAVVGGKLCGGRANRIGEPGAHEAAGGDPGGKMSGVDLGKAGEDRGEAVGVGKDVTEAQFTRILVDAANDLSAQSIEAGSSGLLAPAGLSPAIKGEDKEPEGSEPVQLKPLGALDGVAVEVEEAGVAVGVQGFRTEEFCVDPRPAKAGKGKVGTTDAGKGKGNRLDIDIRSEGIGLLQRFLPEVVEIVRFRVGSGVIVKFFGWQVEAGKGAHGTRV